MKRYFVILSTVIFSAALLISCSGIRNSDENKVPVVDPASGADYSIVEKDGTHYLVFEDASLYDKPFEGCLQYIMEYDTPIEFRDAVLGGKLDETDKRVIVTEFYKDENGFPICDFNHLYYPATPENCSVSAKMGWWRLFLQLEI